MRRNGRSHSSTRLPAQIDSGLGGGWGVGGSASTKAKRKTKGKKKRSSSASLSTPGGRAAGRMMRIALADQRRSLRSLLAEPPVSHFDDSAAASILGTGAPPLGAERPEDESYEAEQDNSGQHLFYESEEPPDQEGEEWQGRGTRRGASGRAGLFGEQTAGGLDDSSVSRSKASVSFAEPPVTGEWEVESELQWGRASETATSLAHSESRHNVSRAAKASRSPASPGRDTSARRGSSDVRAWAAEGLGDPSGDLHPPTLISSRDRQPFAPATHALANSTMVRPPVPPSLAKPSRMRESAVDASEGNRTSSAAPLPYEPSVWHATCSALETACDDLTMELEDVEEERDDSKAAIRRLKEKLLKCRAALKRQRSQSSVAQTAEKRRMQGEIRTLKNELRASETLRKSQEEAHAQLLLRSKRQSSLLSKRLQASDEELNEVKRELEHKTRTLETIHAEIDRYKRECDRLRHELRGAEAAVRVAQEQADAADRTLLFSGLLSAPPSTIQGPGSVHSLMSAMDPSRTVGDDSGSRLTNP